ncbi:hypothetical protein [Micromonospora sp. SH-82]|uniref:hypothetical protein n=1 Tax=Micromonospora sp. SH-82 TaxID=3132938 RepID=UPI003EB778FC
MLRAGTLLALGGTAAAVTGCGLFAREDAPDPAADPLAPLLAGALELAARHRVAVDGDPTLSDRLSPIAEAHQAHAAELARLTGATPSPTPPTPTGGVPTGDASAVLTTLREAERKGREAADQACAEAPADRAALLGSIAAARATHVEALK